jgi:hypothetical protein
MEPEQDSRMNTKNFLKTDMYAVSATPRYLHESHTKKGKIVVFQEGLRLSNTTNSSSW